MQTTVELPAQDSIVVKADDWTMIQSVMNRVISNDLIVTPDEAAALLAMQVIPVHVSTEEPEVEESKNCVVCGRAIFNDGGVWMESNGGTHTCPEPKTTEPAEFTIEDFVAGLQAKSDTYYEEHYPILPKPQFGFSKGPKYIRVFQDNGTQRFVHCFVSRMEGHVYKADGWKGPAKGIRFWTMQEALDACHDGRTGYLYA